MKSFLVLEVLALDSSALAAMAPDANLSVPKPGQWLALKPFRPPASVAAAAPAAMHPAPPACPPRPALLQAHRPQAVPPKAVEAPAPVEETGVERYARHAAAGSAGGYGAGAWGAGWAGGYAHSAWRSSAASSSSGWGWPTRAELGGWKKRGTRGSGASKCPCLLYVASIGARLLTRQFVIRHADGCMGEK